jgi:hypothetical protein
MRPRDCFVAACFEIFSRHFAAIISLVRKSRGAKPRQESGQSTRLKRSREMNRFVAMMSAGAAAILLSGGAMAAEPVATPAQIAAATTPADHEAIAAAYDKEATALDAKAREHEQMAKAYSSAAAKKGMDSAAMHAHCAKLAERYSEAAAENRELAKQHRAMAQ